MDWNATKTTTINIPKWETAKYYYVSLNIFRPSSILFLNQEIIMKNFWPIQKI